MSEPEHEPLLRDALPPRTTPTWEMELLVSGATVFGLLQLLPQADRWLFGLYNTAGDDVAGLVLPLWVYVKFVLLTLSATFVVHLALRGYWVALTGLASVYPGGIRWENLRDKMGPLYLDASLRELEDMAVVIDRADNRASRVFGVGFGMAMMMLLPIVLVVLLMTVMWIWTRFGDPGEDAALWAMGLFLVTTTLFMGIVMWDKARGAKAAPGSLEGRALRASMRAYLSLGFSRASNPLMALFSSNEGSSRTMLVTGGAMTAVFAVVALQGVADRLGWSVGDYAGLPPDLRAEAHTVLPEHYASLRGDTPQLYPLPYIPDPVVRGDYLRLFVPYFPQRHNDAMDENCGAAMADRSAAGPRARLDCLAKLHAIALDGVPLSIRFDAAEDPRSGQRGMLAMIPVGGLAPGRHELTLMPPLRARDHERARERGKPVPPYVIPFWR